MRITGIENATTLSPLEGEHVFNEFLEMAKETAKQGRILARQVANWATSQKRKKIRENKDQL